VSWKLSESGDLIKEQATRLRKAMKRYGERTKRKLLPLKQFASEEQMRKASIKFFMHNYTFHKNKRNKYSKIL